MSGAALQSVLTGALPALESVMLTGIPEVGNALLAEIALGLPLRHVTVARCSSVGDEGLRGLAAACPHLLTLRADACTKITDAGIVALAESCKELQVWPSPWHLCSCLGMVVLPPEPTRSQPRVKGFFV